jgi:hypothetical protein
VRILKSRWAAGIYEQLLVTIRIQPFPFLLEPREIDDINLLSFPRNLYGQVSGRAAF